MSSERGPRLSLLLLLLSVTCVRVTRGEDEVPAPTPTPTPSERPGREGGGGPSTPQCPEPGLGRLPLLTLRCETDGDCAVLGERCCEEGGRRHCRPPLNNTTPRPRPRPRPRPKPRPEPTHRPFLGVVARGCPAEPITESLAVRRCRTDADCWPRICCPDGEHSYCRTAAPRWDSLPRLQGLKKAVAYLQCTPPPPPAFDVFPKLCRTTIDCFPNLCCQERHRKVCRPPKKSLLALIASIMQV